MKIYVDANYDSSTPIPAGYDAAVTSIKDAITEAEKTTDYVTIEIAAGDYTEGIINFGTRTFEENGTTYTGGITFKAVDGAVVNINGCFQCNSPANDIKDVVFEGLNITNSVINGGYFAPIMFGDNYAGKTASGLAVKNCTLNSTAVGGTASGVALAMTLKCDGIDITENIINADCGVYGGDGNLIANTNISGNTMNGNETVPNYNYWGMVYIYNSGEGNVISGNEITGSALDYAVRVRNGEGVILTDNIITDCGEVKFTSGSVVSGNTVDGEALVFPAYKGKELLVSTGLAGKDGETVIIDEMAYTVGTNVFADTKAALTKANELGGATIVVGDAANDPQNTELAITKAGTYIVTGGNGEIFTPVRADGKDVALKFDNAFITLGKLRGGKDSSGYQKNSVTVDNSVIASTNYGGYAGGWATFYDCAFTINNSIFGGDLINKYGDDLQDLPRSASDVKTAIAEGSYSLAIGSGFNGMHIATGNLFDVDNSTVFTGFLSIGDRGYADIDNSVIYVCGSFGVGDGRIVNGADTNQTGQMNASPDGYRTGKVATVDITDSIVRNITLNTNGGGLQVGSNDKAGILNITNSEFDFSTVGAKSNIAAIYENGTVNITKSTFKAGTLDNDGTVTVADESTLVIGSYDDDNNPAGGVSGKAVIIKNGAALVNSTVAGPKLEPSGKANDPEASDAYTSYVLSVNGNEAGTAYFKGTNKIASLDAAAGDTVIVSGQGNSLEFTGDGFKLGNGAKWEITDGAAVSGWALSLDNVADGQSFNSEMLVQNAAMTVDKISAKGTTAGQEIGAGKFDVTFDKADVTLIGSTAIEIPAQDTAKINLTFKNGTTIKGKNGADSIKRLKNDAAGSVITFDNTDVTVTETFRNKGTIYIQNGADVVAEKLYVTGEHYSANEGTINIIGGSLTHENLLNSGTVTVTGGTLDADKLTNNSNNFHINGGSTVLVDKLVNNAKLFISGENTIKVEDATGSGYAIRVNDGAIFNDSYIKAGDNATTRLLGSATFNGGFSAAYFETNPGEVSEEAAAGEYTITIEDDTVINASYGFDFKGNYTISGGKLVLSGGNANGEIWGFVFQSGNFDINSDIEVDGNGVTAPIYFTDATATVRSDISHANSGGEPIYISNSNVTMTAGSTWTAKTGVHINANSTLTINDGLIQGNINNNGTIVINVTDTNRNKVATVIDANKGANFGKVVIDDADAAAGITYHIDEANGDLVVFNKSLANTVYVNANWADSDYAFGQEFESGKYFGINALTELTPATFSGMTDDLVINVYSDIDAEWINTTMNGKEVFGQAITFQKAAGVDGDVTVTLPTITTSIGGENYAGYFTKDLTIGEGVKLDTNKNSMDYGNALRFAPAGDKLTLTVDGTFIYSTGDFGVAKLGEDGLPVMIPTATDGLYDYQTDEATGKIALEEGKSVEVVVNAGGKMLACGESNVTFLANSKLSVTGTGTAEDKMDEVQFSAGSFASFAGEVNFKNTNVEIAGMSSYILGPDANVPDETFTGDKVLTAENTVINIVDYTGNPNVVAFNKTSNLTNTDISAGNLFVKGKTITMNGGSLTLTSGEADASLGPTDDYKSTGKLGISENAELIAKGSALIDVESVANSGKLTIDGALFNGGTVENDGIISIKGDSTVNATVTGNALQVASGAAVTGNLTADLNLKGNVTLNGKFIGVVTGNKNITVSSGLYQFQGTAEAKSVINSIVTTNDSKVGFNFTNTTVGSVTLNGDFNMFIVAVGATVNNITIDGTVNYVPGFLPIVQLGDTAITGKNNAELNLSISGNTFSGNKITGVKLNLKNVDLANGVNISIDSLANIKSINGNAVVNVGGLYTLVSGEQTYILAQDENKVAFSTSSNPDEVAIDSLKKLDVKEDNTSLADINVEMAKGTTTIKVANGKTVKGGGIDLLEFAIGGISKSENGGKNNLTFGNFTDVEINGAVDALGSLTIGKDSIVKVEGTVSGNNTAQKVSIGAGTNATFADFNFDNNRNAADKDSFSVAAGAIVTTGSINGLDKLTIASGKTNAQSEMTINGNFAASHANNSITLGNYADLKIYGKIDNGTDTSTGTTIKAGNFSSIEVYGNVNGLAGLTIGKESYFTAASINGTEKANKINIGAGAEVEVDAIDLKDGKNSIVLGKDAYLTADSISNAMTINIGSNKAHLNVGGAIDGVQKLTVGKGSFLDAASISGTEGNDTFNFANESWNGASFAKIALDFGAGNDTVKVGNNAKAYFGDAAFGEGNDKLTVGSSSIVTFGKLDMGEADNGKDKDTLTIGKNSKVYVDELAGVETINATKGAELWFNNGADVDIDGILDTVAGSWSKNATLMDDCGTLAAGNNAGSVYYSNEWDVYSVDTTSGGTLTLEGTGVEFQYSIDGGNWLVGNEITFKAGADVDIRVTVAEEFNKEKKDYSFSATLA